MVVKLKFPAGGVSGSGRVRVKTSARLDLFGAQVRIEVVGHGFLTRHRADEHLLAVQVTVPRLIEGTRIFIFSPNSFWSMEVMLRKVMQCY